MSYFAIQVQTRGEDRYIHLAEKALATGRLQDRGMILLPRRKLKTRKRGITTDNLLPLYPGYVFYRTDALDTEVYQSLRRVPGFYRFLRYGDRPEPLTGEDEKLLLHFLSFGEVVESSRVHFDVDNKIQVISGPMEGLEGRIVKVNKRKGRAKVRLSLYDNSFLVDFAFEMIRQAEKSNEK